MPRQFADLQGLGVASMVVSHRHMDPHHWRLDFVNIKPYLLTSINNNMGASTTLGYRSSAQYWLDDKQANPALTSALPMPVPTLARVATVDEITGNSVTQRYSFHHGVYDGIEREFRGFGLVCAQDTQQVAQTVQSNVPLAAPLLTKSWYHTGRDTDEASLFGTPYQDADAIVIKPTRFTKYDAQSMGTSTLARWMSRLAIGCFARSRVAVAHGSLRTGRQRQSKHPLYGVGLASPGSSCPAGFRSGKSHCLAGGSRTGGLCLRAYRG